MERINAAWNRRSDRSHREQQSGNDQRVLIPMKVVIDSDLIPVTGSEVKLIVFGAKRRWRSYPA
jgi:hypothetical protein